MVNITSLVVPISIGLGTACLGTAYWFFKLEMTQRRRAERALLQQTNRERLVNQIAQHIRQSLNLNEVLATTVEDVQRFLQADRVLIYRLSDDGTGCAIHESVLPPYLKVLGQTFPAEVFPPEYHEAYSLGKTRAITNVEQADIEPCLTDFVKQFGVQAKLVVPIIQENRDIVEEETPPPNLSSPYLWGLLIVHQCSCPRQWETWEIELMQSLATQVAVAIQQSELYTQLQVLNQQLEQRVQNRTADLAASNTSLRAEILERQRTELALRHTNETLQALVTASPRAIVMLDREGRVKIWNPAAEQMFGWTEAEVLDYPSPIGLEDPKLDYPTLQANVLHGTTYSRLEFRQRTKDGLTIDIIFSAAPLTDSDGQISGIVAVIADVTEQKERAEQLRLLQSVVVNTNDAVIITEAAPIDEPGPRIIYANEAFTRITGYQSDEVLGKNPRILQGPKTDQSELQKIRRALAGWESVTVEVINYRKDGTEFWNEFSIVPVSDEMGIYTHWIAVQRDTTGRKQVEYALRQSEERFRSLIENSLDIIMILESEGTIEYVSPSSEKILGHPAKALVGNKVTDFIHPEDLNVHLDLLQCTLHEHLENTGKFPSLSSPIEFRYRSREGSWRILEAISQSFLDSTATPRMMVSARDITERKRLDEMRLALDKEKELSILKTRFFSMASHEFRTPLSTALAAAQVLENSQGDWENTEKRLRNLHRIQDSIKNMVQLLDDILIINRAETGKLPFKPRLINLELYVRHFLDEIQAHVGLRHTLIFNCQGPVRSTNLDEKLIYSILSNLISNAIKYSPKGGEIRLSLCFQSAAVVIEVSDQGIGISAADQKQLFEPFHRGENVRSIPGTGLGLVVVKKCVDLHRGVIKFSSEVGKGTTCLITIPVPESQDNPESRNT